MKSLVSFIPLSILLLSCGKEQSPVAGDAAADSARIGYVSPLPEWSEEDYTGWMSRAELQHLQDMSSSDLYFAYVEGRSRHGVAEFRAVKKKLQTAEYSQWAVFWGIEEKELFDWELRLLRTGFERQSMQVFFDSTGKAIHQIVWLRPVGAIDNVPDEVASQNAVEPDMPVSADGDEEPPAATIVLPENDAPTIVLPDVPPDVHRVYEVVPGDNLGSIARKFKTTVSLIKKENGLKNDILRIGQKLEIP